MQKTSPPPHQPLHNICIYSAFLATDREIYLENSYVPGPCAAVSAAKLQFWATSHRQTTQQMALQSRAESTDCKAENPAFPSLSTPGASLLLKASYLCCGEETASFFLCCFESLANLGLCDLAISSNVALSTPKTPTSTGVLNRHEIEKYNEDHSGFGECWRGKATSTHCP